MGVKSYKLLQYDADTPNVPVITTIEVAQISDLSSSISTAISAAIAAAASAYATSTQGTKADSALQPGGAGTVATDTGWTANSTVGDKTAALTGYTNGLDGTMVAALNLVSANTGTALSTALDVIILLVKKVAALQTCLVANKVPNA